jgi:hypothetical protein
MHSLDHRHFRQIGQGDHLHLQLVLEEQELGVVVGLIALVELEPLVGFPKMLFPPLAPTQDHRVVLALLALSSPPLVFLAQEQP